MSEENTKYSGRPDHIDNGQWHLAVCISDQGVGAWLVPDASLGRSPKVLVSECWEPSGEGLLRRIEDAVYDNPTILDDYSADIIIESDRQLWLPSELYPSDEDCAEAYTKIYGGSEFDVLVNESGTEKNAFSLTAGLKSFMQRTFPGARIWSQQTLLKEAAMQPHDSFKCLVDIRENAADIVVLRRGELLCAASHPWKSETDISYILMNILNTYEADPAGTELIFSGIREVRQNLGRTLQPYLKSISQKNHDLDGKAIPTAVYLAINRKKKYANHSR